MKIAERLGDINELLSSTDELNNYPPEQWEKTYNSLIKLGFAPRKFAYVISQYPKIITMSDDRITTAVNNWLNFEFDQSEALQLLERYPELLEINNFKRVFENLNIVKTLVGQKNGFKVLFNTPTIANEKSSSLEEKVVYLRDVMKVDPVEVYKSEVFCRNLFKIKARHVFMERLGMYVVSKKKKDEDIEVSKNPKLYKMMDTSDKRFATKVCHVTLEEYETFEELYKKELMRAEEEKDREDDLSDDEDHSSHIYYNH